MNTTETEQRLRETLDALASQVSPDRDAYRRVAATWRWRELRRRLIMLSLAVVIITAAVVLGLWLLNHVAANDQVVFQGPAPAGFGIRTSAG